MKKFLTLRNIVLCAGALLLLVAFFLSFGAKATGVEMGMKSAYNNIIWGCDSLTINGETHTLAEIMGFKAAKPAALPLVGLILMLVAALGAVVVALFVKKPWAKWVVLALAVLAVAGAVFQFFAMQGFCRGMVLAIAEKNGVTDKQAIEEAYNTYLQKMKDADVKFTMSTVMGVLGIVGGLAVGASQFLPEKK